MDIYAPKYYGKFKCIADKCKNSCCIDWEIDIDETTYERYLALDGERGAAILSTIENEGEAPHFTLGRDGRCKNLDERGLCKIITALGEGYLCDICHLHPRFINDLGDHEEIGLGLSCEEAARIILTENEPFELVKIGENDDECDECMTYNEALEVREDIIRSIEKRGGSFASSIDEIKEKYGLNTSSTSIEEWVNVLLSYEILSEEWGCILENALKKDKTCETSPFDSHFEALFKYLVFRHVATAGSELELKARIAFAALLTEVVLFLAEREAELTESRLLDLARLLSSEIEYSEENTESLILELEAELI